jgi:hypothetical protein
MVTKRTWGGRPSKGDRDLIAARPPAALGAAVRVAADARSMTISDYVTTILADVHGMPECAPKPHPTSDQGEFTIEKGGGRLPRSA